MTTPTRPRRDAHEIEIDGRRVGQAVAVLVALLIASTAVADLVLAPALGPAAASRTRELLSMTVEGSLATFAAMLLLLAVAAGGAMNALLEHHEHREGWFVWVWIALGFTAMGADEILAIHPAFGRPVRDLLGADVTSAAWVVAGFVVVLVVAGLTVPLLGRLPRETRRWLVVGACVFVAGALGLETVESLLVDRGASRDSLLLVVLAVLEESLEAIGTGLALWATVRHAGLAHRRTVIRWVDPSDASTSTDTGPPAGDGG